MGRDESPDSTPPESDSSEEAAPRLRFGLYLRDIGTSLGAVVLVGLFLFAVSGVWPPLVAIESGSMEPHIDTGDMVFIMDEERFPGPEANHGVVTAATGSESGYQSFERSGDVIVFQPNGDDRRTPVIHRAMLWVETGENWYPRADSASLSGADNCQALRNCPAPHSGFVTKGDNNGAYDQVTGSSTVVRPEWVIGTGVVRIPRIGYVRVQPAQAQVEQASGPGPDSTAATAH